MLRLGMLELILVAGVLLADLEPATCDVLCERQAATQLIDQGDFRAAVQRLKEARRRFPDDHNLVLLLARSYLLQENLFWAERTLTEAIVQWPEDSELRAWLTAVQLRQGDPDLVSTEFDLDLETTSGPDRSRWYLLAASRARLVGQTPKAEQQLAKIKRNDLLYPEDLPLWQSLNSGLNPWWRESISGTLETGLGHTSNALAGSPTDPGTSGDASTMLPFELRSRFAPPSRGSFTPAIDLELLGNKLFDEASEDMSSVQASLRLGAMVPSKNHRWSFGYRAEALYLDQDDPLFSESHRAEAELEWATGKVVFFGAGHRDYRDDLRTRWEGEIGFGGPIRASQKMPVIAGATLRLANADSQAYDQRGISAAVSSTIPLGRRFSMRMALSGVWDDYPNSGGDEGRLVFGTKKKRRDLLGRFGLTLWAPDWHGLRPGIEARYTRRNSTADEMPGFDFSYREWRVVALVRWSFSGDPWAPQTSRVKGHIPLDWGLESKKGMDQERILDLLRGDEELRRGSSCGVR